MIYLVSKIIISLLAALAIGFGMAWTLQMHLAARLREQLNSVIFETKSRIPQLESEITNRDQVIDGLREAGIEAPQDVLITGFDGLPQATWAGYDLTTLEQPTELLVETAVATVIGAVAGGATSPTIGTVATSVQLPGSVRQGRTTTTAKEEHA